MHIDPKSPAQDPSLARTVLCFLFAILAAVHGSAQTTLEPDQMLQPGATWASPEDFGHSVDTDGDRLVVGEKEAVLEYLWDEAAAQWIPARTLVDLNQTVLDVAVSGSRLAYLTLTSVEILGPPDLSIPLIHTADSIALSGTVLAIGYVIGQEVEIYHAPLDGSPAKLSQVLAPAGQDTRWDFGYDLSLSSGAGFLAVGAPELVETETGRAYVYVQNAPTIHRPAEAPFPTGTFVDWHLYQHVEADNGYGRSVALNEDGSLLVVGAPLEDTSGGTQNVGGVFIYDNFDFSFDAVFGGGQENANLGHSVDVHDRTVLGGASSYYHVVPGLGRNPEGTIIAFSGRGVLFEERQPNQWQRVAFLGGPESAEESQRLGRSAALTARAAVLGAPNRNLGTSHPIRGAVLSFPRPALFTDGFESGDTTAW